MGERVALARSYAMEPIGRVREGIPNPGAGGDLRGRRPKAIAGWTRRGAQNAERAGIGYVAGIQVFTLQFARIQVAFESIGDPIPFCYCPARLLILNVRERPSRFSRCPSIQHFIQLLMGIR